MSEALQKAFDFAQATTTQVLTLSSAIVTITVTFLNGELKSYATATRTWLEAGWLLYLLSVLGGVVTLMALSGNLERPNKPTEAAKPPSIYRSNIRWPSAFQLVTFFLAVGCTLVFGWKAA